ncbi:hypothetical protein K435DRAFT_860919 [Dendrothele bispora CBS 962.96]|uniref:Uncharacterized protein n=1 Tax=Dendrothele bispora (strain CBS 962.96) TaxID=1314807 RepID=A0A4V4HF92_DENBC|nr:hypothetical protein K435DRAFT_860919 [Dendrothele bispora CBS 962.96]
MSDKSRFSKADSPKNLAEPRSTATLFHFSGSARSRQALAYQKVGSMKTISEGMIISLAELLGTPVSLSDGYSLTISSSSSSSISNVFTCDDIQGLCLLFFSIVPSVVIIGVIIYLFSPPKPPKSNFKSNYRFTVPCSNPFRLILPLDSTAYDIIPCLLGLARLYRSQRKGLPRHFNVHGQQSSTLWEGVLGSLADTEEDEVGSRSNTSRNENPNPSLIVMDSTLSFPHSSTFYASNEDDTDDRYGSQA